MNAISMEFFYIKMSFEGLWNNIYLHGLLKNLTVLIDDSILFHIHYIFS